MQGAPIMRVLGSFQFCNNRRAMACADWVFNLPIPIYYYLSPLLNFRAILVGIST